MRILHLFDICGIGSHLSEFCDKTYGTKSTIITTTKNDKFRHSKGTRVNNRYVFMLKAMYHAYTSDAVIVHGNLNLFKYLRLTGKPMFLYAHGSEIRGRWRERENQLKHVRHVFVSTRDLLDGAPVGKATYIPNPVSSIFKPHKDPKQPRAMTFSYGADEEAKTLAESHNLPLDIIPRQLDHSEIPHLFRKYTHYIDIKRDFMGRLIVDSDKGSYSLTALEALSSGLKVITSKGLIEHFPSVHTVENAGDLFYKNLMQTIM